jgi:hypothetical protein
LIGKQISMGRRRLIALGEAARLLDLGMEGLPSEVVRRSRALTAEEEEDDFRLHPLRSLETARDADVPYEAALADAIHRQPSAPAHG